MTRVEPAWVQVALAGSALVGVFALAGHLDKPQVRPAQPLVPYEWCLAAANDPASGFATEVCEPLSPGYTHPPVPRWTAEGCLKVAGRNAGTYCPEDRR